MVKTSASSYKERSKVKQLVILLTYKMNVKCIKLDQMISHSPNKGDCQRIMTEQLLSGERNAVLQSDRYNKAGDKYR